MDIKKLFLDNPHRKHIKVAGGNVEVGLCEVELTPTRMRDGSRRPNKPVRIYDTCGAWGDPDFHFDTSKGLPKMRRRQKIRSAAERFCAERRGRARPKWRTQRRA